MADLLDIGKDRATVSFNKAAQASSNRRHLHSVMNKKANDKLELEYAKEYLYF